jgi:hypothetical protein
MKSTNRLHRLITLLTGFFVSLLISRICDATWDYNTYNGLPIQPPLPWYSLLLEMIFYTVLWSPIVWLPAVIGLFKSTSTQEPKA